LGVSIRTPNKMVYGDLQRFPLYVNSSLRVMKYWIRLLSMNENRLPKQTYNMLLSLDENGWNCWVTQVKMFLFKYGFQYVWHCQNAQVANSVLPYIRQRLIDTFVQEWDYCIRSSERFKIYRNLKSDFFCMNCIFEIDVYCYRRAFIQLRMDVLPINSNIHRFSEIPGDKQCPWCPGVIEDVVHVVKECQLYNELRGKICTYVSYVPFHVLLDGKNIRTTKEVAKFIFLAMKHRHFVLNQ